MKGRIELVLHEPNQLFNSMDPSPFVDKDLDGDAEEFILNWEQEYSHREPLSLTIHLEHMPAEDPTAPPVFRMAPPPRSAPEPSPAAEPRAPVEPVRVRKP